jgi:hypothetical protein
VRPDKYHGGVPTDHLRRFTRPTTPIRDWTIPRALRILARFLRPFHSGTWWLWRRQMLMEKRLRAQLEGTRKVRDPGLAIMIALSKSIGATMMAGGAPRGLTRAVIGSAFATGSGLTSFQGRTAPAAVLTLGDVEGTGLNAADVNAPTVYNVMNSAYGATGNGVTDDTAAIQAAINAAHAAGGGVVDLAGATVNFQFSNLVMYAYVTLQGESIHHTPLTRITGSTGSAITDAQSGNPGGGVAMVIRNVIINGNGTSGDCINLGNGSFQFTSGAYLEHDYVFDFPSGTAFNVKGNAVWFADLWGESSENGFVLSGSANRFFGLWAEFNTQYEIESNEAYSSFWGIQIENTGTSGTNPCILINDTNTFWDGIYINFGDTGSPGGTKPALISIHSSNSDLVIRNVNVIGAGTYTNTILSDSSGFPGTGVQAFIDSFIYESGGSKSFFQDSGSGALTQGPPAIVNQQNQLGSPVTMVTPATFYDGPTLTLAAGTWLLIGKLSLTASSTGARNLQVKLWDGTNVYDTANFEVTGTASDAIVAVPVFAIITLASGDTVKISATSTSANDVIDSAPKSSLLAVSMS